MSNETQELAGVIADTYLNNMGAGPLAPKLTNIDLAEAILEAGYRKPRTVTTIEEIDALPEGTIILDSDPDAMLKDADGWRSLLVPDVKLKSFTIGLPATVLHDPAAK